MAIKADPSNPVTAESARLYQICTRCIMDTTDPKIRFDEKGVCDHCYTYDERVAKYVHTGETGRRELNTLVNRIKQDGAKKQYDSVIGVSGGVDSTFVAYKVKQLGLRPLAVHLDNGWDSELAVKNIEQSLKLLKIDLFTRVLDWEEFKNLQLSFLKASTPDSEIPSDHAIISIMRHMAKKIEVKYIISGVNVRTESHLPAAWSQGHLDWRYIAGIQKRFGTLKLKTFPHMAYGTQIYFRLTQEWIDILNYLDYSKQEAVSILEREIGWKYYGGKHYESIYTRFYQGYWLPRKFGYDKRRTHLSSLICSGEMTRAQALKVLESPSYPPTLQEEDIAYVIKKFGLTKEEFQAILDLPARTYEEYSNYLSLSRKLRPLSWFARRFLRIPV